MFVLSAADGCIPSDLATGTPAEIEEERRLMYVAMTRAKNSLASSTRCASSSASSTGYGDRHVFTPRTRFIPDAIVDRFERVVPGRAPPATTRPPPAPARAPHRRRRPPARHLGDARGGPDRARSIVTNHAAADPIRSPRPA